MNVLVSQEVWWCDDFGSESDDAQDDDLLELEPPENANSNSNSEGASLDPSWEIGDGSEKLGRNPGLRFKEEGRWQSGTLAVTDRCVGWFLGRVDATQESAWKSPALSGTLPFWNGTVIVPAFHGPKRSRKQHKLRRCCFRIDDVAGSDREPMLKVCARVTVRRDRWLELLNRAKSVACQNALVRSSLHQQAAVRIQRYVRGWLARRAHGNLVKVNRIFGEFRSTEESYTEQLRAAADFVIPALVEYAQQRGNSEKVAESAMTIANVCLESMKSLAAQHVRICDGLGVNNARRPRSYASVLEAVSSQASRDLYEKYCTSYDNISLAGKGSSLSPLAVVTQDAGANQAFKASLTRAGEKLSKDRTAQWRFWPLASFLILPVQRLPRYKLLCGEVRKALQTLPTTWRARIEELDGIVRVESAVTSMLETINAKKKESDILADAVRVAIALGQSEAWLSMPIVAAIKALKRGHAMPHLRTLRSSSLKVAASPPVREFVDELVIDLVEASAITHAHADKYRTHVKAFVLTDMIVLARPKKRDSSAGWRVIEAIPLDKVVDVGIFETVIRITEEKRVRSYPFVLRQEMLLADPTVDSEGAKDMNEFRSVTATAGGNANIASSRRLLHSLVLLLDGTANVSASTKRAENLESVLQESPSLSSAEWQAILSIGDRVVCKAGDWLIRKGDSFAGLHFVDEGEFSVWVPDPTSPQQQKQVKTLVRDDFFGEMSLISGSGATADVRCESAEARVTRVLPDQLLEVLSVRAENVELCERFFKLLVHSFSVRMFARAAIDTDVETETSGDAFSESGLSDSGHSEEGNRKRLSDSSHHRKESGLVDVQIVRSLQSSTERRVRRSRTASVAKSDDCFGDVQCRRSGKKAITGQILVTQSGVQFSGKYFGLKQSLSWSTKEIRKCRRLHATEVSLLSDVTLSFSNEDDCMKFLASTERLMQKKGSRKSMDGERESGTELPSAAGNTHTWDLGSDGWDEIREASEGMDMPHGHTTVVRQGETVFPAAIWQIETGKCRVQTAQGAKLGVLGPGDVFGEFSFFFGGPQTTTVVSIAHDHTPKRKLVRQRTIAALSKSNPTSTDEHEKCTRLIKVTRSSLHSLFETNSVVVVQFYRSVAAQLVARMSG